VGPRPEASVKHASSRGVDSVFFQDSSRSLNTAKRGRDALIMADVIQVELEIIDYRLRIVACAYIGNLQLVNLFEQREIEFKSDPSATVFFVRAAFLRFLEQMFRMLIPRSNT
jgi:hypothetical protein